jgi:hypothetical protein
MRKGLLFFFLSIINLSCGQVASPSSIAGKVNANTMDLDGIYVINVNTEKSTITRGGGYFSIVAIPGDVLLFSAIHLKEHRITLIQEDFIKEPIEVKMETIMNQLDEVLVSRYNNINAVSLGISPDGIQHLTQAERHLRTASGTDFMPNSGGSSAGGSVSLDPLLNLISGRTSMLRKELEAEKKLSNIALVEKMFGESLFVDSLEIPADYLKGFEYYLVENEDFVYLLGTKSKSSIKFMMGELAVKYKEIIASEKE